METEVVKQEPGTALTIAQRAAIALGSSEHEKKLVELAEYAKGVTAIVNAVTYQECHGARMSLKNGRIAVEKAGKAAREEAIAYSKGIITEEKRLISIGSAEETRLQNMQDAWDMRVAAEKAERERIEAERIERIQSTIENDIKLSVVGAVNRGSVVIETILNDVKAIEINDTFAEFREAAEAAKAQAVIKLTELHAAALEHEEDQRRVRQEREELALLQAAEKKRQEEAALIAAEAIRKQGAEEKAARDRIDAEERAARARIAAQEEEARALRQAEHDKQMAVLKAQEALQRQERDRIAALAMELELRQRAEREAAEAKAKAERDEQERVEREARQAEEVRQRADREQAQRAQEGLEAKEREAKRKENELLDGRSLLTAFQEQYGHLNEFKPVSKAIAAYLARTTRQPAQEAA